MNHCSDFNPKYTQWLPSNADIVDLLQEAGSPKEIYVFSYSRAIDAQTMPLKEAVETVSQMPENGWGTILSCIAGELAYYYDEEGERRALLQRKPGT